MNMTILQTNQSKPKKVDRNQIIGLMDDDFERVENRPVQNTTVSELQKLPEHQVEGTIYFNRPSKSEVVEQANQVAEAKWEETKTSIPDVFQKEFATFNLNPSVDSSPKVDILDQAGQIAEAAFSTVGSIGKVTEGTGEAVADLWKNIFGVGEYKNSPQESNTRPNAQPGSKEQQSPSQGKTLTVEAIQNWFAELKRNQSEEVSRIKLQESLRIVGRVITEEDTEAVGVSSSKEDLLKSATLHIVADTEEKHIEEYKEQKQTKEDQKMQQFTGENALLMGGERSGGGHWSTTPG